MELQFAAQSYTAHSAPLDSQRCVNFFPEIAPKDAKIQVPVYGCAGIIGFATCGTTGGPLGIGGPIQGMCMMNDLLYVVSGQVLYSVTSAGVATNLGTTYVTGLVSMDTNGTDLVWVDGATGWWYSKTTGVQQIIDPNFYPADVVVYFDGYFVFNRSGTLQFFLSPIFGVVPFDGALFASKESTADNLISIVNTHEQLQLFGETRTEIWFDAGNAPPTFPFQRYDGAFIQRGIIGPWGVCLEDNTTFFMGEDGVFYRLEFTLPLRISTHATEKAWQTYPTMKDLRCFSYTMEGHKFITLQFPSAAATWVYDVASGLWHERESWNGDNEDTSIGRWRVNCVAQVYNRVLVGDCLTGQIGQLTYNEYTEFGSTMRGLVSSPPVQADRQRVYMRRFELDVESGVGLPYAPAFASIPYLLGSIVAVLPTILQTASGLANLPASFSAFLFAAWVYLPDDGLPNGLWFSNQASDTSPGTPGLQIGIFNDQTGTPQIVVRAWDAASASIVTASFDFTGWANWTLLMIAVDTATQTIQVWYNNGGADTALSPAALTWASSNPVDAPPLVPWHLAPAAGNMPTPEYQVTPVNGGVGTALVFDGGNNMFNSTQPRLLASVWIETPSGFGSTGYFQFTFNVFIGAPSFNFVVSGGGATLQWWDGLGNSGNATIPPSAIDYTKPFLHVIFSVDASTSQAQVYVNGVAATPTTSFAAATIQASNYTPKVTVSPASGDTVCAGDLYIGTPAAFYDLSVAANLAAFIHPITGFPVSLGTNGQLPTGTAPIVFLTVPLGGPAVDFRANNGTGGGFGTPLSGTLATCAPFPGLIGGEFEAANVFFANTAALFDLTVAANRGKIVSSGDAVYPGTDNKGVLGTVPPVFLTRMATDPVGVFPANAGSGGPFAVVGGVITPGATAPTGVPFEEQLYAGLNLPVGADPQIMLDWSDDGGRTWSLLKKWRSMGKMGEYRKRLRWLKMGQARQRVLRLKVTDPVRRNLIGFYLDTEEGQK